MSTTVATPVADAKFGAAIAVAYRARDAALFAEAANRPATKGPDEVAIQAILDTYDVACQDAEDIHVIESREEAQSIRDAEDRAVAHAFIKRVTGGVR